MFPTLDKKMLQFRPRILPNNKKCKKFRIMKKMKMRLGVKFEIFLLDGI